MINWNVVRIIIRIRLLRAGISLLFVPKPMVVEIAADRARFVDIRLEAISLYTTSVDVRRLYIRYPIIVVRNL